MKLMKSINSVSILVLLASTSGFAASPWIEFSEFERSGQCPAMLAKASNPDVLNGWNQDSLDLLYGCATSGPIPDGMMPGKVILAQDGLIQDLAPFLQAVGINLAGSDIKHFAETLWAGKEFHKKDRYLQNNIGPDARPILNHPIAGQMRFPAKLYCGQSILDGRRESIIIDYLYSNEITDARGTRLFDPAIDWIAAGEFPNGVSGMKVRDEIRMIRPGFYLGRAYMDRFFVLNFTLYRPQSPTPGGDECWVGHQRLAQLGMPR